MECIQKEDGFTLIEMMIVLLIISVLILIAIPNVTKHSQSIDKKGCEAYQNIIDMKYHSYKPMYINGSGFGAQIKAQYKDKIK